MRTARAAASEALWSEVDGRTFDWRCEVPGYVAVVAAWRCGELSAEAAMAQCCELADRCYWPGAEDSLADLGAAVGAAVDVRFQDVWADVYDQRPEPARSEGKRLRDNPRVRHYLKKFYNRLFPLSLCGVVEGSPVGVE